MAYSTLILTKNERDNLSRCLDSLADCDDVVVLDSESTDGTQQLANQRGVRLFSRSFDNFANQRNWAIDNVPFRHAWVLHLDADECVTPALHAELLAVTRDDCRSAFLVANKLIFMGRWIRHASMYPYYQARVLRLGESRFQQTGHGQHLEYASRGTGRLREPYLHYNFSKGISDWVERHNRYSTDEAKRLTGESGSHRGRISDAIFSRSAEAKQQARKRLADLIPLRPVARFIYGYFLRLGFLDGMPGFHYCMLLAIYDYLIRLKAAEFREKYAECRRRGVCEAPRTPHELA